MRVPRHRTRSPRHWAWMLWFALLLPVAQVASAAHALSHPVEPAAVHADKGAPHSFGCDLCLTAAALHGGALHSEPPSLPFFAAGDETPEHAPAGTWQALLAPAYQSRAPPHATV